MRLIDADSNIEIMKKCAANPESEQALLCYRYTQRILENAPTVEPDSPWHRVEEKPKEDGWYSLVFYQDGEMVTGGFLHSLTAGWPQGRRRRTHESKA